MTIDTVVKEAEVEATDEVQNQTVETEEVPAGEEPTTDTATVEGEEKEGEKQEKKDGEIVSPEEIMSGSELSDVEKAKLGTPFGVQKRFDELTKKNRELETKNKELESIKTPVSKDRPLPPKNSDYVDDSEYQKALVEWKDADDDWKDAAKASETQGKEVAEHQNKNVQRYLDDSERMRAKFSDFDDITSAENMQYAVEIAAMVLDTNHAPEMNYYLGKNPAELDRIQKLSPLKAAVEIGKLEARFESVRTKKTSKAPAVLNTIKSKSDTVIEDISKIKNDDAWFKARQAEKLRKLKEK